MPSGSRRLEVLDVRGLRKRREEEKRRADKKRREQTGGGAEKKRMAGVTEEESRKEKKSREAERRGEIIGPRIIQFCLGPSRTVFLLLRS